MGDSHNELANRQVQPRCYLAQFYLDSGAPILVPDDVPQKALRTSVCRGDGSCSLMHLELHDVESHEDGSFSTMEPSAGDGAWFDTETGELGPEESAAAQWLAEHLDAIEPRLRQRWEREQARADDNAWRRFDWAELEAGILAARREVFPADWDPTVRLDGRLYLADDMYCVNPSCDCTRATVILRELREEGPANEVGVVEVDVGDDAISGENPSGDLARRVWARFKERSDFPERMPEERARMRAAASAAQSAGLYAPAGSSVETFRREQPKVGRNAPCPCGSGKKHKRCCLGKSASTL